MRLIVGITGASGAIFGIRALEILKSLGVETHLVTSRWARTTIAHETTYTLEQVEGSGFVRSQRRQPGGSHFERIFSDGRDDCCAVQYEDAGGDPSRL